MEEPVLSPSGQLWLRFVPTDDHPDNHGLVRLQIGEVGGDPVYVSLMSWAGWFSLAGRWDDADRVWVASADVGVAVFARDGGTWRRYAWEAGVPAAGRDSMLDVTTGELVSWIDAIPPADLRTGVHHGR